MKWKFVRLLHARLSYEPLWNYAFSRNRLKIKHSNVMVQLSGRLKRIDVWIPVTLDFIQSELSDKNTFTFTEKVSYPRSREPRRKSLRTWQTRKHGFLTRAFITRYYTVNSRLGFFTSGYYPERRINKAIAWPLPICSVLFVLWARPTTPT